MMKKNIVAKVNPLEEAMRLLQSIANKKSKDYLIKSLEDISNHSLEESTLKKIDIISNIQNDVEDMLSYYMDDVRHYFSSSDDGRKGPLVRILYLYDSFMNLEVDNLSEWLEQIKSMDSERYYADLAAHVSTLDSKINDVTGMELPNTFEGVFKHILTSNLDDTRKIEIQDILLNRDAHFEKTIPIIETAILGIKKHFDEIEMLQNSFVKYWEEKLRDEDILTYFKRETGMELTADTNPYGWKLKSTIFSVSGFGYSISMDNETGEYLDSDTCTIGIIFDDDYLLRDCSLYKPIMDEEQAIKIFKLLSDKSKLEILKLTSKEPSYGVEIAEHLGITTATVSYHTNELHDNGLLNVEKRGNKIYYSARNDTIEKLIDYLRNVL